MVDGIHPKRKKCCLTFILRVERLEMGGHEITKPHGPLLKSLRLGNIKGDKRAQLSPASNMAGALEMAIWNVLPL